MTSAEFEEKEYEGPLYRELLFGDHRIATPGQVFENAFGIDSILKATHPMFWDLFGYRDIPLGITLNDFRWGWVWRRYGRHRDLPSFDINLLIQAKRPDYLKGRNANLAKSGIKKSYWRFSVRAHQQMMLERLENQLRNRALVVYASPAFHELRSLYSFTESREIVDHSSFVRPLRMREHHHWNYNRPGCVGVASSKPEAIEEPLLYEMLDQRLSKVRTADPSESLNELQAVIDIVLKESEDSPLTREFLRCYREISIRNDYGREERRLIKFLRISSFFRMLSLEWFVVGKHDSQQVAAGNVR